MSKVTIRYARPAEINQYEKQKAFIDCAQRFAIVEATTKAGKTSGCIVWLYEEALQGTFGDNYWWVAPTSKIAKIAFRRMQRYIQPRKMFVVNKSEMTITLINGTVIFFKTADDPDGLYGEDVMAAVLDEATRMKKDSWIAVFSTLTATEGRCKIIGNVKGIGNWVYELAREAETGNKQNWAYFKITADDAVKAGILKQAVIDEARRTLPEGVFLELYYAIPFVNSSDKFVYSFDKSKHVRKCKVDYDYPIFLSFDFNRNPISCTVIQHIEGRVKVPFVIKLPNSNIYKLCEHIKNKFRPKDGGEPHFIINGDASGNSGSAMVKDNLNYFRIIKSELNVPQSQMQQLASNPKIEENQVLVNAVLEHVPHDIDPTNAAGLIFDFEFATMLPDGTLKKTDRKDPTQQLEALDGYRYWCNRNMRHFLRGYRE
jgi:hypothetical protein